MNPNKSPNKATKSPLGLSLLAEKHQKSLVPPILEQVGKLAAGVASVRTDLSPNSTGSATGNPRNKVALQPGHSLMDWIRLGASGKDLSGVGPRAGRLTVTKHELSNHNKLTDIWLAIRGKVYNVTAYVPFHPGGPEELMRAAGIDATRLFDQVHPWVNYDQILQKCFVGRLVSMDPEAETDAAAAAESFSSFFLNVKPPSSQSINNQTTVAAELSPSRKTLQEATTATVTAKRTDYPPPRFDWIQKLNNITLIFYTRSFSNPLVEIFPPTVQNTVRIVLIYDEMRYENEVMFYEEIRWPCVTKVSCETGKIELNFEKLNAQVWENYGRLQQKCLKEEAVNNDRYNFVFKFIDRVTHNIFLINLQQTDGSKIVVPLGKHVKVTVNVDGVELSRSYTPVPEFLFSGRSRHHSTTDSIYLMIKRYPEGPVSSYLTDRQVNDMVYLSRPLGDFDLSSVEKKETFVMLAAGTGFTPMIGLILFLLERRIKKCQFLRLMFFNRTQMDIPLKDALHNLTQSDKRFKVDHILSEPDDDWGGLSGHVSRELIENAILEHIKDTGYTIADVFFFVCGPSRFVTLAVEELLELEVANEHINVFQG